MRGFVNSAAVRAGWIHPHDPEKPGWRATAEGRAQVEAGEVFESALDVDGDKEVQVPSNSARGAAFELYIFDLMKRMYPGYAWYQQGAHRAHERGIDLLGNRLGQGADGPKRVGVQVKCHAANNAPTQTEWLKFLSGCYARGIDEAVFVTTGRLTGEQHREASECHVVVLQGESEIYRFAERHGMGSFSVLDLNVEQ